MPFLQSTGGNPLGIQALAVIGDFNHHLTRFVPGFEPDGPARLLARPNPLVRRFEAVVGGIADHVGEGIGEAFDEALIELDVAADHLDLDVLVQGLRHVAHHPRKLAEDIADGLHPRLHDGVLQFRGDQIDPLGTGHQGPAVVLHHRFAQLVAAQNQLSRQVHQRFEQLHVDAQGAFPGWRRDLGLGFRFRTFLTSAKSLGWGRFPNTCRRGSRRLLGDGRKSRCRLWWHRDHFRRGRGHHLRQRRAPLSNAFLGSIRVKHQADFSLAYLKEASDDVRVENGGKGQEQGHPVGNGAVEGPDSVEIGSTVKDFP